MCQKFIKYRKFNGIRLEDYRFSRSSSGIIIANAKKQRNVHLTFCVNNKLNALDMHLKNQFSKQIINRFLIPIDYLEEITNALKSEIIKKWCRIIRPIDIEKLRHAEWKAFVFREIELQDLFIKSGKIENQKLTIIPTQLFQNFSKYLSISILHPLELNRINFDCMIQLVFLISTGKRNSGKIHYLFVLNSTNNRGYYILNPHVFIKKLSRKIIYDFSEKIESFENDLEKYFDPIEFGKIWTLN